MPPPTKPKETVKQEIAKHPLALELLFYLNEAGQRITLTGLAQKLNRSLSTVHEALMYLLENRVVKSTKEGREKFYTLADRGQWVRDLVEDPERRSQLASSVYRLQKEAPHFIMHDFTSQLGQYIKEAGLSFESEVLLETSLGPVSVDFLLKTSQGKVIAIEIRRLRQVQSVRERLLASIGKLTIILKGPTRLDGFLLVLLLPHEKLPSHLDKWRAMELISDLGDSKTLTSLLVEYVDDIHLLNQSFIKELASQITSKVRDLGSSGS